MHGRRAEPGGSIGQPHVPRPRLQGVVQEPADLRKQGGFGCRENPGPQRPPDIERPRRLGHRLASTPAKATNTETTVAEAKIESTAIGTSSRGFHDWSADVIDFGQAAAGRCAFAC